MYQLGKRTKKKSNPKAFVQFALVLGISFVAVVLILKNDTAITSKEKTTVPIVSEVAGATDDSFDVNESLFGMKLPSDWKLSQRVQAHYANYYEWRSTKQGGDDRLLRLHINKMPESYKLVRMVSIVPKDNKLSVGNISGNCANFATGLNASLSNNNQPAEAKWENVSFICDPIENNQTIGTGTPGGSIPTTLKTSQGDTSLFFYYEDHNIRPDDQIFKSALNSFYTK